MGPNRLGSEVTNKKQMNWQHPPLEKSIEKDIIVYRLKKVTSYYYIDLPVSPFQINLHFYLREVDFYSWLKESYYLFTLKYLPF